MSNDITILYGIIILFVAVGALLPGFQKEFGQEVGQDWRSDTDNIHNEQVSGIQDDTGWLGVAPSVFSVIKSIASMFIWTFGGLPWWLDLFLFVPLRLIAFGIVARNIWIGGGG